MYVKAEAAQLELTSKKNASWQVNTKEPTAEQLKALFDIKRGSAEQQTLSMIIVDDSLVNYNQVGRYTVAFYAVTGEKVEAILVIQKNSPVVLQKSPILQLAVGENPVISNDLLEKYLASAENDGFDYKIIDHNINLNKIGKYTVRTELTDLYGRTLEKQIMAEVVDLEAPTIQMENQKLTYIVGHKISTTELAQDIGLSAQDNYNEDVNYEWYLNKLDSAVLGDYKVGVRATDESGNSSSIQYMTISIEKLEVMKQFLQYEVKQKKSEAEVKMDLSLESTDVINLTAVNFNEVGLYQMPVFLENKIQRIVEVNIVDTVAPTIITATTSLNYEDASQISKKQLYEDLQLKVEDNYDEDVMVSFSKSMKELTRSGQHQVVINAKDRSGNESEEPVTIQVGQTAQIAASKKAELPPPASTNKEESEKRGIFKSRTIYASAEEEQVKTEALQPIEKLANSLQENKVTTKEGSYFVLFIASVIVLLLLIAVVLEFRNHMKRMESMEPISKKRYSK